MGVTAERLARRPHVKPGYVKAHHNKWLHEGRDTGILVTRLRDGDPIEVPLSAEEREHKDRRRYIEGEFAEFIQH